MTPEELNQARTRYNCSHCERTTAPGECKYGTWLLHRLTKIGRETCVMFVPDQEEEQKK